jgi:phosphoenolpyruvate carboxylase
MVFAHERALLNLVEDVISAKFPQYYDDFILLKQSDFNTNDYFIQHHSDISRLTLLFKGQTLKLILLQAHEYMKVARSFQYNLSEMMRSTCASADDFLQAIKGAQIKPVLTAHPTEQLSTDAIIIVEKIYQLLEKGDSNILDIEEIKGLILEFLHADISPITSASVEVEAMRNLIYLRKFFFSYPRFRQNIIKYFRQAYPEHTQEQMLALEACLESFFEVKSWVGGDADGNSNVTPEAMSVVANIHQQMAIDWHMQHIEKILQRFPMYSQEALEGVLQYLDGLAKQGQGPIVLDMNRVNSILDNQIDNFDEGVKERSYLEGLRANFKIFSSHLARIDVRQNANIIDKAIAELMHHTNQCNYNKLDERQKSGVLHLVIKDRHFLAHVMSAYQEGEFANLKVLQRELSRVVKAKEYNHIFTRYVISETHRLSHVLGVLLLCRIADVQMQIIPLFETYQAIEDSEAILRSMLQDQFYCEYQKQFTEQIIMMGYSDAQKQNGLAILPYIEAKNRRLQRVGEGLGVKIEIFHGCGMDLGRGGPAFFNPHQTIQGNHLRYEFITLNSTYLYCQKILFAQLNRQHKLKQLPSTLAAIGVDSIEALENLVLEAADKGCKQYRDLFAAKQKDVLEEYLANHSCYWTLVKTCNFSSRASNRISETKAGNPLELIWDKLPSSKVLEGVRAITQVNTIENSGSNFNLWYGVYSFLKQLLHSLPIEQVTQAELLDILCTQIFSLTDVISKALIGIQTTDFNIAWSYFSEKKLPKNTNELAQLVDNYRSKVEGREASSLTAIEFLAFLQKSFLELQEFLSGYSVVDGELAEVIEVTANIAKPARIYASYITKGIVQQQVSAASFHKGSDIDSVCRLYGTVYACLAECRTPPYLYTDLFFQRLVPAAKLQ